MGIFALLRSSGGRSAAAWCAHSAVQPPVLRRNERRLRARPRAPWTFPASLPPWAAFASACLARLRSSASRNLRLISSSEPSGSGAASVIQTSRDGHIHSFAHVIPACPLAGWLVVIGVASERIVMPRCSGRAGAEARPCLCPAADHCRVRQRSPCSARAPRSGVLARPVALLALLRVEGWAVQGEAGIPLEVRPLACAGHRTEAEIAVRQLALDARDAWRAVVAPRRDCLMATGGEQPPHRPGEHR